MMSMSAEELRAEIEETRREAETEEAKFPELAAETEQARERLKLRQELLTMRCRLGDARVRNLNEIDLRQDIDELSPRFDSDSGHNPGKQAVMQARLGDCTSFGDTVAKGEYVWRIEGFSWAPCTIDMVEIGCVISHRSLELGNHSFRFRYSPWANFICPRHHGSLAIVTLSHDCCAIRYRIYVKARNGQYVRWGETHDVVHRGWAPCAYGPDVHWPGHPPASLGIFGLSHEELLQSEWVENDTLTVKFELEVRPSVFPRGQPLNLAAEVPEPTLHKDTGALWREGTCSDVRFMLQDEVIHAHSQVLCARSEVFSKQLMGGMQESLSKVIVIDDCDLSTFKAFLQFLYTDELPDTQEVYANGTSGESENKSGIPQLSQIQALLAVSHKYQVKRLQRWCEARLSQQIEKSEVCGMLCQAHLLQARQLEKACLSFIKNHASEVLTLPAYVELVQKWPQIGVKVSLFSAGVSDAELWTAMDGLEKPQGQPPEQATEEGSPP